MPLYQSSTVSVSTCLELSANGHVSYELDVDNECVNFIFGYHRDYQLELRGQDLRKMIELGNQALAEIASELAKEQEEAACRTS